MERWTEITKELGVHLQQGTALQNEGGQGHIAEAHPKADLESLVMMEFI